MIKYLLPILVILLLLSGCSNDEKELGPCAEEGEQMSFIGTEGYPERCCEGLTEWASGMDTRVSIGLDCYETGLIAGAPFGTCITCGDGSCGSIENVCNCPEDCKTTEKSDYQTLDDFCGGGYDSYCYELLPENEALCSLCGEAE